MHYANADLGGATAAYKKDFLGQIDNAHSYYMPPLHGMCGGPYNEMDADHHVTIRVEDTEAFKKTLNELTDKHGFTPLFNTHYADEVIPFSQEKTYKELTYEKREYNRPEVDPGDGNIDIEG
jgi:hypothetical protein